MPAVLDFCHAQEETHKPNAPFPRRAEGHRAEVSVTSSTARRDSQTWRPAHCNLTDYFLKLKSSSCSILRWSLSL